MFKNTSLIPEIDLIEAFGFWLKHVHPDWHISRSEAKFADAAELHPVFFLYEKGVSVGQYTSPLEALARIGDDRLTSEYLLLTAKLDDSNEAEQDSRYNA